jgi:hypothetical protein
MGGPERDRHGPDFGATSSRVKDRSTQAAPPPILHGPFTTSPLYRKLKRVLTVSALTVASIAVAGAGIVTGLTGFGFALVSVPLLLVVMDPASVVTTVLVIGQLTSSVNAWTARAPPWRPTSRSPAPSAS